MKSNVCKINQGNKDLAVILKESEKVAKYNGLDHKKTMQLRLLCEEIDGLLPNIISEFEGDLWIEFEGDLCRINVSIHVPEFTVAKKRELVGIAKNKKNAAACGLVGKIRSAIESFFLKEEMVSAFDASAGAFYLAAGYSSGPDYSHFWSLEQYRSTVKKEERAEAWDELEKSVISSVADDVIVGVKGNRADIVIVKSFA